MGKTVLILGGGTGGVAAANVLRKTLPEDHRVRIVDRRDMHYYQAGYPFVMAHLQRPDDVTKRLPRLRRKRIEFVRAEITQVSPEIRRVQTDQGDLEYDYLIISLGAAHHSETIPGQAQGAYNPFSFDGVCRLRDRLASFQGGEIVVFIASLPYTGAIAPYEIVFLLDAYFRQRGRRKQIGITLVTPEDSLLPIARPKVGESLRRMMERRQVKMFTQTKILSLDAEKGHLKLDDGTDLLGDLFIGIPSHRGPAALRNSDLVVEGGWIDVDPYTLATRAENVYAVGDATAIKVPTTKAWAPKAGFFAHYQAEVVARNIALEITGQKPRFHFTGKAAGAVMATGFGRGRALSIDYFAQPLPRVTLLRPTRIAYWLKMAFQKYWMSRWL